MTIPGPTVTPGWYADAYQPGMLRWHDGQQWTAHTHPAAPSPHPGGGQLGQGSHEPFRTAYPYAAPQHGKDKHALHWVVPVDRRGWAIAAGYTGIATLPCFFLAPVALALGIWALVDLRRNGGYGKGRAWFAVVVGAICTPLLLWVVATGAFGS